MMFLKGFKQVLKFCIYSHQKLNPKNTDAKAKTEKP